MSTEMSCHFIYKFKKNAFEVFHDLIHVYSPGIGADSPLGDKLLMSTERPYHFTHLLQVSKKSLASLILYNFFHDLIHVHSPGQGAYSPQGRKFLYQQKILVTLLICC